MLAPYPTFTTVTARQQSGVVSITTATVFDHLQPVMNDRYGASTSANRDALSGGGLGGHLGWALLTICL